MDQADDASLEDLEEVIYLEDMEDIEAEKAVEILEAAPPYPGHPSDYGGTDLNHQPGYHSSPYPTVNVGYTAYPEPGLKAGVNNQNFQAGPNPGMYPPGTSSNPGMYPQATGPNPGMYPQASTVTTSVMLPSLRDLPGQTMCPHCNHQVITITDYYTGLMTWMACGCLALVGCWPCCIAPFWMDSCKDVEHRCPNCNNILSFYRRL
ncbi:lipopolysaccharide-induced tumor necrosis factor-alpha factor homolog isoform X3 [Xyrauchen texanus]|uniref:lipopolysaccharide-induced tumor necrosis factor-alpha factor homolog isoform X2 n=1 Tax=Xyrauchen texanus TaxID=154827 RepID=UPI002241B636|nr:lipopolysaccharide-induced tumor necrosis factor-alpha factor homolog isoform X2 [Xyrauchen texanus]XP_051987336.1 lipopolysaccharide-induced tumor necrosis factor-alpha factor homolog isoform X3 [Xyrauchen texanus]